MLGRSGSEVIDTIIPIISFSGDVTAKIFSVLVSVSCTSLISPGVVIADSTFFAQSGIGRYVSSSSKCLPRRVTFGS